MFNFNYQVYIKDHLGNVRAIVKGVAASPTLVEEMHYYPFGMRMEGDNWAAPTGTDLGGKYQYNGKEMVGALGLNWLDYGARWYDPSVGRWMMVDPMAEEMTAWSPYNYVLGNPVQQALRHDGYKN